jgi:homospermidine synthase
LAYASLEKIKVNDYMRPSETHLINKDIVSGSEAVGIILSGRFFKTRYFGSVVDVEKLRQEFVAESPTIVQVSASCIAAFK